MQSSISSELSETTHVLKFIRLNAAGVQITSYKKVKRQLVNTINYLYDQNLNVLLQNDLNETCTTPGLQGSNATGYQRTGSAVVTSVCTEVSDNAWL